jgi:hypothetical protein
VKAMSLSKSEIKELMKEKPQIWEGGSRHSNRMCKCGHKEKYHHNHKDSAWGVYSWCRRCMLCEWNGENACNMFTEIKEEGNKE